MFGHSTYPGAKFLRGMKKFCTKFVSDLKELPMEELHDTEILLKDKKGYSPAKKRRYIDWSKIHKTIRSPWNVFYKFFLKQGE